jgi:hypothetical protein
VGFTIESYGKETAQKAISRSQNVYLTDADKTAQKAISRSQNVYLTDAK